MKSPEINEKLQQISELMEPVTEDTTVPRNIRQVVKETKEKILQKDEEASVNIATAIYMLDEVSNDINMPFHTRTEIWNIVSHLEKLKEEIKDK